MLSSYIKHLHCTNIHAIRDVLNNRKTRTLYFESYFINMSSDDSDIHSVLIHMFPKVFAQIIFDYLPYCFSINVYFSEYDIWSLEPSFSLNIRIGEGVYTFDLDTDSKLTRRYIDKIYVRHPELHEYLCYDDYFSRSFETYINFMSLCKYTANHHELASKLNLIITGSVDKVSILNINTFLLVMISVYMIQRYVNNSLQCMIS